MLPDTNTPAHAEALLESARSHLTQRLRAGEPCYSEELFRQFPALLDHPELALQLVCTEFTVRLELGQQTRLDDWFERFPQWRDQLRERLAVYAGNGAGSRPHSDTSPTVVYAPPEDETASRVERPVRLGRYELLQQVGIGGMGIVHKARQLPPLERIVALKLLRAGRLAHPEEIQRFSFEAKVGGGLRHSNILPIYELNDHDGQLFLTMPYIEGGNLAKHLARFRDDARAAVVLVEKIARAVHFLHEHGILHRDLKPSNILLDEHDEPLVTDFGLAKLLEDDVQLTETGRVMGTPAYLSPEQAAGRNKEVAATSDVWALGVIAYELLTGKRPFHTADRDDLYGLVQTAEPEPPSNLTPGVDASLESIVLKCLAKEPAERYATAGAFADHLRLWLDGHGPKPARRGWRTQAMRSVRRRQWIGIAALSAAFAVVGLGAGYVLLPPRAPASTKPADDPADAALADLRAGRAVTWIKEKGPPLRYNARIAAEHFAAGKKPDEAFWFTATPLVQFELISAPMPDDYTLRFEVQQSQNLENVGEVGITLGLRSLTTPDGVQHHCLLTLAAFEPNDKEEQPGAELKIIYAKESNQPMSIFRFTTAVKGKLPRGKPDAAAPWRAFDVRVTPDHIRVVCDGQALGEIKWTTIARNTNVLLKPQAADWLGDPPFHAGDGVGVYVLRGTGSFRSFVVTPTPTSP